MNIVNTFIELDKINESQEPIRESQSIDPVSKILNAMPDFEFEYEGFKEDCYRNYWNYDRQAPDQKTWVETYPDFIYKEDAMTVFEDIWNFLERDSDKLPDDDFWQEFKNRYNAWVEAYEATNGKDDSEALEYLNLWVVENLAKLVEYYEEELIEEYNEKAMDWALEHLEPEDPSDRYY